MYFVQVLAVNAAKDATDLVAKLRAYHTIAQTNADKKHLSRYFIFELFCEWHFGLIKRIFSSLKVLTVKFISRQVEILLFYLSLHINWFGHLLNYCSMGLDLSNGTIRKNLEAGVIEPAMSKVKIIQVNVVEHTNALTNS
jgi:chaperonin GroEL (HSP60 family)